MAQAWKSAPELEARKAVPRSAVPSVTSGKLRIAERIENAMFVVAKLLEHDEVYLPIFLRLENELIKAREQQDALQRARTLIRRRT